MRVKERVTTNAVRGVSSEDGSSTRGGLTRQLILGSGHVMQHFRTNVGAEAGTEGPPVLVCSGVFCTHDSTQTRGLSLSGLTLTRAAFIRRHARRSASSRQNRYQ